VGALPSASASPPTNSVCTGSSRPPPSGSVLRSRYSSTTCQPSSGRLLLPKVSGPISHPTRAACARSTSSPSESRRVGFGHTTLPTSVGSSESVVRAAGAMVFVPVPATDAACRAQVSWHGRRRSSGTGREPSGARSPCSQARRPAGSRRSAAGLLPNGGHMSSSAHMYDVAVVGGGAARTTKAGRPADRLLKDPLGFASSAGRWSSDRSSRERRPSSDGWRSSGAASRDPSWSL
jgi:hypothetical protein